MKSVMSHSFGVIPDAKIQRSAFNRSHGYKTTMDAGYLVPFFVDEALPGDTFKLRATVFGRLATPIRPLMDNLWLDTHFFAVPVRLIWSNFKKFMGEQANPGDSTSYTVPQMTAPAVTGHVVGSLSDYMGIPTGIASLSHSSLWHRAYNLIWNEWYRDQNLQSSVVVDVDDGPDTSTDYALLKRGKRHDYFTSCLPWPQKGTAVSVPLGSTAPVIGIGVQSGDTSGLSGAAYWDATSTTNTSARYGWQSNARAIFVQAEDQSGALAASNTNRPNVYADLSAATASTINQLRQAFQTQKLYERDARGGTRYIELVRSHFGVVSPDARQQRPEYLGGGTSRISIHPVAQTSSTDATTPQGNLSGFGTVLAGGHGFVKSFTEHCVLLGLVSVRADLNYQQGLNRMFSRSTRLDFYWPSLAHIGEQAVLNKEIYAQNDSNDALTFGYQERYGEYKYKPSLITGKFRSTYSTPLDSWHLAQKFTSLPTLNSTFIQETPPMSRVKAVNTEPDMVFDAYFDMKCVRPMPMYSVPGLIDHF